MNNSAQHFIKTYMLSCKYIGKLIHFDSTSHANSPLVFLKWPIQAETGAFENYLNPLLSNWQCGLCCRALRMIWFCIILAYISRPGGLDLILTGNIWHFPITIRKMFCTIVTEMWKCSLNKRFVGNEFMWALSNIHGYNTLTKRSCSSVCRNNMII